MRTNGDIQSAWEKTFINGCTYVEKKHLLTLITRQLNKLQSIHCVIVIRNLARSIPYWFKISISPNGFTVPRHSWMVGIISIRMSFGIKFFGLTLTVRDLVILSLVNEFKSKYKASLKICFVSTGFFFFLIFSNPKHFLFIYLLFSHTNTQCEEKRGKKKPQRKNQKNVKMLRYAVFQSYTVFWTII